MSVSQTATGNAWVVVLPAGSVITTPSPDVIDSLRAVAVNETTSAGPNSLRLRSPLRLASPPWFVRNDEYIKYLLQHQKATP